MTLKQRDILDSCLRGGALYQLPEDDPHAEPETADDWWSNCQAALGDEAPAALVAKIASARDAWEAAGRPPARVAGGA